MNNFEKILRIQADIANQHAVKIISYSQYSKWAKCPLSWKLHYIDKHKLSNPSVILLFGTSIHETVQLYIKTMFDKSIKAANSINLLEVLKEQMTNNYANLYISNNNVHFSTKEEMNEFLVDGNKILEYIQKHRAKYFTTKGYELIGIEVPISIVASEKNENVYFLGYIDLMLYDKDLDKIIIYDFKTSRSGWRDKDKKDDIKKRQLVLYKNYVSKILSISPDKIEVKFMILKRKVNEDAEYANARKYIQEFKPSDGPRIRKITQEEIDKFILTCFNADGQYNINASYPAIAGDNASNCTYCEYKTNYELCPREKRRTVTVK